MNPARYPPWGVLLASLALFGLATIEQTPKSNSVVWPQDATTVRAQSARRLLRIRAKLVRLSCYEF